MLYWFPLYNKAKRSYYICILSFLILPPLPPSHPSRLSQTIRLKSVCYTATSHQLLLLLLSRFSRVRLCMTPQMAVHQADQFTYSSIYVSMLLSQSIPPSPSPTVSTSLFSTSASPFLSCKQVHQYHFSRFHIYALICNIYFSLYDLLHCV